MFFPCKWVLKFYWEHKETIFAQKNFLCPFVLSKYVSLRNLDQLFLDDNCHLHSWMKIIKEKDHFCLK
jgi:hypothetical protein